MIRRPPRSTLSSSSAASDVYKRQLTNPVDKNQLIMFNAAFSSPPCLWAPTVTAPAAVFVQSGGVMGNSLCHACLNKHVQRSIKALNCALVLKKYTGEPIITPSGTGSIKYFIQSYQS